MNEEATNEEATDEETTNEYICWRVIKIYSENKCLTPNNLVEKWFKVYIESKYLTPNIFVEQWLEFTLLRASNIWLPAAEKARLNVKVELQPIDQVHLKYITNQINLKHITGQIHLRHMYQPN